MNYNKGFAPIAILLIILGIAAVGGVAYYTGKNSPSKNEVSTTYLSPKEEQNINTTGQTTQQQQTPVAQNTSGCTTTSSPSITLLSPNGGEIYKSGQKITVKWKSCNVASDNINIMVIKHNSSAPYQQKEEAHSDTGLSLGNYNRTNDGTEEVTLPSSMNAVVTSGQHYFISITGLVESARAVTVKDYSDGLFTINRPTPLSLTLPTPYVTSGNGIWPPVIQTSTTAYSCTPSGAGSDTETIQKIINGRTYCFTMSDGVGAGNVHLGYTYTTANGSGTKTTNFSINYRNNCDDYYSGSQQTDCQAAHSMFANYNFDLFIDSLM